MDLYDEAAFRFPLKEYVTPIRTSFFYLPDGEKVGYLLFSSSLLINDDIIEEKDSVAYGIAVVLWSKEGNLPEEKDYIYDLCRHLEEAERYFDLLTSYEVTPCSFRDVLEDLLA